MSALLPKTDVYRTSSQGGLFGLIPNFLRMNQSHRSGALKGQRFDHPPPGDASPRFAQRWSRVGSKKFSVTCGEMYVVSQPVRRQSAPRDLATPTPDEVARLGRGT
jgi:hypothetical protein